MTVKRPLLTLRGDRLRLARTATLGLLLSALTLIGLTLSEDKVGQSQARPVYEAHTVVDLVSESQCRVIIYTPTGTPFRVGCAPYPGFAEVGSEFIPTNGDALYFTDSTGRGR